MPSPKTVRINIDELQELLYAYVTLESVCKDLTLSNEFTKHLKKIKRIHVKWLIGICNVRQGKDQSVDQTKRNIDKIIKASDNYHTMEDAEDHINKVTEAIAMYRTNEAAEKLEALNIEGSQTGRIEGNGPDSVTKIEKGKR